MRPGRPPSPNRPSAAIPVIALAVGVGAGSMSFWVPFLPLYLLELGADSDAAALGWAGLAYAGLGIGRLVVAPVWGVLADRFGRKAMFVRALLFASTTTIVAGVATDPWHIVLAFTLQGLLSGFVPAANALTSVSAPESRMGQAMGMVNAAQYLGATLGPLAGAALAVALGFRGAILVGALVPAAAALLVAVAVPGDRVDRSAPTNDAPITATPAPVALEADGPEGSVARLRRAMADLGLRPVRVGLVLSFLQYAVAQAIRVTLPLVLAGMVVGSPEGIVGVAVAVGGAATVVGVAVAGRRFSRGPVIRPALVVGLLGSAAAALVLAVADAVPLFILGFALISLMQGVLVPGTNTILATAVPRERRGTLFGLVATAQAFAFVIGPLAAAVFATISFALGYALMAGVFVVLAVVVHVALRAPDRPIPAPDAA